MSIQMDTLGGIIEAQAVRRSCALKPKNLIWIVVAVAVIAFGVLSFRPATGGVTNVNSEELEEFVADGVFVIDVRTAGEFDAAHIPGAVNVPVDQVASQLSSWDKSAPIAVYCATGSRSVNAVNELAAAGFTTIYHLNRGIATWTGALDTGTAVAAAPVADEPSASGLPVMYEFFTDW